MKGSDILDFIKSQTVTPLRPLNEDEISALSSALEDFLSLRHTTRLAPGAEPAPKWLQNSLRSLQALSDSGPGSHSEIKYRLRNIINSMEYHSEFSERDIGLVSVEPVARLLHWAGSRDIYPPDKVVSRTYSEYPEEASKKHATWTEGAPLVPASELIEAKQTIAQMKMKLADMQEVCRRAYLVVDESFQKLCDEEGFGPTSILSDLKKASEGSPAQDLSQMNERLHKSFKDTLDSNAALKSNLTWTLKTLDWLSDKDSDGGISTCKKHSGFGFTSDCQICSKVSEIKKLLKEG